MFIRRTVSKNKKYENDKYYTYRLVESYRIGNKVKQRVLLNLGSKFNVDKENWSLLSRRIEDIIKKQDSLFEIDKELENLARQFASQLILSKSKSSEEIETDYNIIDVNSVRNIDPKSIGTEYIIYETIKELEFPNLFKSLSFTQTQIDSILGTLIAKCCYPKSDKGSIEWLKEISGAGELYSCNYNNISSNSFYRASDLLYKNRDKIEQHLYNQTKKIFQYDETITLYDLTNTYFEGDAKNITKAARGRSKEKRSDAKLITLAVVLDSSGFIRKSKFYEGNIGEPKTLQEVIDTLQTDKTLNSKTILNTTETKQSLIIMDAGIASQENIDYLKDNGYEYLVVSRKKEKLFDDDKAVDVKVDKNNNAIVRAQKVVIKDEEGEIEETLLYCHSKPREAKENSMQQRVESKFIDSLKYLNDGLSKPRRMKKYDKVLEKVGVLKNSNSTISKYYEVSVKKDPNSDNALSITWREKIGTDDKSAMNGVYCLRTNNITLSEEQLWKTYTTLTDLEAVFRCLKTELGLRPIFHQTSSRVDGHLFITLIAYSIIHTIRYKLKAKGINYSWDKLRDITKPQIRVTTSMKCKDGRVLYVRKSSILNEKQKDIYDNLSLKYRAGRDTKVYI